MTHDDINSSGLINLGSVAAVYHTIDITALDGATYENYNPDSETGINNARSVEVVAMENGGSYDAVWDHKDSRLEVVSTDGTDPTADTDVGEVKLKVLGV